MGATTNILQNWIDQMMIEKNIKTYTVDMSGSSTTGDGYMGEINFVKVICDLGKGVTKVYDIVIKSARSNDAVRKNLPILETYEREMVMYTEVFPIIDHLQKENAIENQFSNYPELYSVCTTNKQEAILLGNLKNSGYVVHDRLVPHNLDHITLVLRKYAQWHGSSFAFKLKKPELFEEITADMTDIMDIFVNDCKMLPMYEKSMNKSIENLKKRGYTMIAEKIRNATKDISAILTKMTINNDSEAYTEAVILHGDCWNNNIMFKYKENDTSKPIDLKFLDFQCSRVASPILDLSYYLYSVTDKVALDKFDYLLEEYHKALTDYLVQFDISCDDIFTLQRLRESWKKYGKYGLVLCPFELRIELSQEGEFIDFNKEAANKTSSDIDFENMKYQDEYNRRIFDVYSHFVEKFLCLL